MNGICDGCNVREPWEHRCHGEPCQCEECADELHDLFPGSGAVAAAAAQAVLL